VGVTVILDGLDEAKDADSVRKAINYWLNSRLGRKAVLVVSSRPEFWKTCVDRAWGIWMPKNEIDGREPTSIAAEVYLDRVEPTDGIPLPDRFTEDELKGAWVRAGCLLTQLSALPQEAREELRHPFTLRVYLDLLAGQGGPPKRITRSDLLETWLSRRLEKEAVPTERLAPQQFRDALIAIALRVAKDGGGSLPVDELTNVPRFDPTAPPGPIVERLLRANILESVPGRPDRIRFVFEAVQDFYRAEAEIIAIEKDPEQAAKQIAALRFTDAYPRLARIGRLLIDKEARHQYAKYLAAADPRKAAIVVRCDPSRYEPSVRQQVTDGLGQQIADRHRIRGALAIQLLGDLQCEESCRCLAQHLLPSEQPHQTLRTIGARAFGKLGDRAGMTLLYGCHWFGRLPWIAAHHYDAEMIGILRSTPPGFREALAEYALQRLEAPSGSEEHARAACVLAYLGDNRLASHLQQRLVANGFLLADENHALIALGTSEAGEVFYHSAMAAAETISTLRNSDDRKAMEEAQSRVSPAWSAQEHLYSPELEPYIIKLVQHDNEEASWIGYQWAMHTRHPSLVYHAIEALARRKWELPSRRNVRENISPDAWLAWWKGATSSAIRWTLLCFLPVVPNVEIEEVLVDCLDDADLRGQAALNLGYFRCYRSATNLRNLLTASVDDVGLGAKACAADALGWLRDQASVKPLHALALEHGNTNAELSAIAALGFIGTHEAEQALHNLLGTTPNEQAVAMALICCGSRSAVSKAVEVARSRPEGPTWFCQCVGMASWKHGWRSGEYYTHVATEELTEYFAAAEEQVIDDRRTEVLLALQHIDSQKVRELLKRWASKGDALTSSTDCSTKQAEFSHLCYEELMRRGDVFAVEHFLEYRADDRDDMFVRVAEHYLSHFPSDAVANALRPRFVGTLDNSAAFRLLWLLGRFGNGDDEALIRPYLDHADDLVANVTCEALLRLTDPMLIPDRW
jgi:HEAT repeat protein